MLAEKYVADRGIAEPVSGDDVAAIMRRPGTAGASPHPTRSKITTSISPSRGRDIAVSEPAKPAAKLEGLGARAATLRPKRSRTTSTTTDELVAAS